MAESLETLKAKADTIGVAYPADVTFTALKALIAEQQVPGAPDDGAEPEKTMEEMKVESDAAIAKLKEKNAKPEEEKLYTRSDFQVMLKEALRAMKKEDYDADRPEEHLKTVHTARLARFKNKFIVALKDMNDDEYVSDVIYSWDLFDEKTKRDIAWITLIFDDGTELAQPLHNVMKSFHPVPCDIVEVKTKDASYKLGKIAVLNDDGQPSGETVDGKVQQVSNRWILKLPTTGKLVEVGPEVLNW